MGRSKKYKGEWRNFLISEKITGQIESDHDNIQKKVPHSRRPACFQKSITARDVDFQLLNTTPCVHVLSPNDITDDVYTPALEKLEFRDRSKDF